MMFGLRTRDLDRNPLNIWPGAPEWEGETTEDTGAATRADFKDAVFGFRAGGRWLILQGDKPGANTLNGLLAAWKTAKYRANPTDYAAGLSGTLGWALDETFNPKAYRDAYAFLRAVVIQERGTFAPYKGWMLTEGLRRAGLADVPPSPWHKRVSAMGGAVAVVAGVADPATTMLNAHLGWLATSDSSVLRDVYHLISVAGGALAVYGTVLQAKRQGV